jgi:hypothetical protein
VRSDVAAAHEKLRITFVVINNREYNVLKKFMRTQQHYASAPANRFIAMDIVDPPSTFCRFPPLRVCPPAGRPSRHRAGAQGNHLLRYSDRDPNQL